MQVTYEVGDCAIAVGIHSVEKNFQIMFLNGSSHFCHGFGSKLNLQQSGHHWHVPFILIAVVQIRP